MDYIKPLGSEKGSRFIKLKQNNYERSAETAGQILIQRHLNLNLLRSTVVFVHTSNIGPTRDLPFLNFQIEAIFT